MAPSFSWGGIYVGSYGLYAVSTSNFEAGVQVGYNLVRGRFLAGIEARIGYIFGAPPSFGVFLDGRAGMLLGDRTLVYAIAGVGTYPGIGATYYDYGAGVEVSLGTRMSVLIEAKGIGVWGVACCGTTVRTGVNFHPGN